MKQLPVIQPSGVAATRPTSGPMQTSGMVNDPDKGAALRPSIVKALSTVFDPEIPVNVYELGLIYDVIVEASGAVGIRMTLTAPACPAAQYLPGQIKDKVAAVPGVTEVKLDVVWDPPWDRDRMSEAARLQLGMF
jgi:FeS assembly SUF system protein